MGISRMEKKKREKGVWGGKSRTERMKRTGKTKRVVRMRGPKQSCKAGVKQRRKGQKKKDDT